MFCGNCGQQMTDGATFCPNCGCAPIQQRPNSQTAPSSGYQTQQYQNPPQQPYTPPTPSYTPPASGYTPPAPGYGTYAPPAHAHVPYAAPTGYPAAPALSMKWFKFLINFALFFGAFINIGNAGNLFSGNVYGSDAELVYDVFPDMKTLDMIYGALLIILAGLQIYTRFRLSGYRKDGPMMVTIVYAANALFGLVYLIGAIAILSDNNATEDLIVSASTSLSTSIIILCANIAYFNKRKHLFVR